MNHCINCGNNILNEVKTCGEAGFGDGCGNTLSNMPKQPPEGRVSVESIVEEFPYYEKEIMPSGAEWILIDKEVLRTTLTAERTRHAEEKERLVREILALAYYDDWECHVIDHIKVEEIAAKFNIDVK